MRIVTLSLIGIAWLAVCLTAAPTLAWAATVFWAVLVTVGLSSISLTQGLENKGPSSEGASDRPAAAL